VSHAAVFSRQLRSRWRQSSGVRHFLVRAYAAVRPEAARVGLLTDILHWTSVANRHRQDDNQS